MRSARRDGKSLVRRVALAAAMAAGLGGAAAAVAVGTTATGLLSSHDEDTLRAAAFELAQEVEEEVLDLAEDEPRLLHEYPRRLYEGSAQIESTPGEGDAPRDPPPHVSIRRRAVCGDAGTVRSGPSVATSGRGGPEQPLPPAQLKSKAVAKSRRSGNAERSVHPRLDSGDG